MPTINDTYQNSLLSQASYTDLPIGTIDESGIDLLVEKGMSIDQATKFASEYTVFDTINDPITGLQATVFEKDGVKILSIAGTDPTSILDLATDFLDIGLAGGTELQPQHTALKNFYSSLPLAPDENEGVKSALDY